MFFYKNPTFKLILVFLLLFLFFKKKKKIEYKNYINIAYTFDKNTIYIAYVSMKSLMLSQNYDTFIQFYLLTNNMNDSDKEIINEIKKEYKNCNLQYFDMGNRFKNLKVPNSMWSTAIFYRIILQDLFPTLNRILYLDTDTLIFKDLTKIYNYNISGKYYIGMLEVWPENYFIKFNVSFNNFINSGVLLCNLHELRKGNISNNIKNFLEKNNNNLSFPINEALNFITHKKNGYFKEEYVVIGFCNVNEAYSYYNSSKIKMNNTKVVNSFKDPYIYHYIIYPKPWKSISNYNGYICLDPIARFYELARKTKYYYKMLDIFKIKYI